MKNKSVKHQHNWYYHDTFYLMYTNKSCYCGVIENKCPSKKDKTICGDITLDLPPEYAQEFTNIRHRGKPKAEKWEDWREEFDNKFVDKLQPHNGDGDAWPGEEGTEYWDTLIDAEDDGKVEEIKSFIKNLLHQQRLDIIEAVDNELDHLRRLINRGNKQAVFARKRIKLLKIKHLK